MLIMILYCNNGVKPLMASDYQRFINDIYKEAGNCMLTYAGVKNNEYAFSIHEEYTIFITGFVPGRDAFIARETRSLINKIKSKNGSLLYGEMSKNNKHLHIRTRKYFQFDRDDLQEHDIYLLHVDGSTSEPVPSLDSERVEFDMEG